MNRVLRRGVLPFVRRRLSFVVIVRDAVLMSMERKKVMKKQRRSNEMELKKLILCSQMRSLKPSEAAAFHTALRD
jgi:hypothetical protein